MFLTQREPERWRLINFRYWTAWTTTQTTLASSWGLLINIDNAIGDIARTTDWWNEDEKYWVYSDILTVWASSEFDSAVTRTWRLTYKASTTDITWTINWTIGLWWWTTATLWLWNLYKYAMPIKASTKYKATCWIKTNNVVTNSAFLQSTTYNSVWTRLTVTSSNKLSWTNDWTLCSINITSDATATHIVFVLANQLAWNISDAWFDINSMTLEEVVEPVAHTFDQSFLTFTPWTALIWAFTWTNYMQSQSFTPAVSNLSWIVLIKLTNTGTPTGNLKIDIRTSSVWDPTSTVLATQTISLSEWNLIPVGEFVVNLWASLTIGTKYSIVLTNTATETGSNWFRIGGLAAWGYAGGDTRYSDDGGTVWVVNGTYDLFFKTFSSSLTSSSPSLVSFTAVGSTDNIDQSQLWVSTNVWLDTPARFWAQQFTPTKSKLTWVVFQKHTTTGTPTWDIIFRIATDSWSDNPTTTILASYTMPSATYNTLSVWVDFTINLPCNLTAWTKYWILFKNSSF